MTPRERAAARIRESASRSARKRIAAEVEAEGVSAKQELIAAAAEAGVELPDDAASWPAKKLLRRAQGREEASRIRKNPIARDEAFECAHCARAVTPHGRSARDHCPHCLHGLHVDGPVPGDRASACGGVLEPVGVGRESGRWILEYRCTKCGAHRRNQVLRDGDPPDDWRLVVALGERP